MHEFLAAAFLSPEKSTLVFRKQTCRKLEELNKAFPLQWLNPAKRFIPVM